MIMQMEIRKWRKKRLRNRHLTRKRRRLNLYLQTRREAVRRHIKMNYDYAISDLSVYRLNSCMIPFTSAFELCKYSFVGLVFTNN